jgi:hypothetical protein
VQFESVSIPVHGICDLDLNQGDAREDEYCFVVPNREVHEMLGRKTIGISRFINRDHHFPPFSIKVLILFIEDGNE